jgi:hypothetical protein
MTFFGDALICQPTVGQWLAMAGWPVLLAGLIVVAVNLIRQCATLRRLDGQGKSERLSASSIAVGWFTLFTGIAMTWYGLHSTWSVGATMGDNVPQGMLLLCYAQSSIPGFMGILIWCGAFCEAAFFKRLWMGRMMKSHNQAPEDTARKLADPQR